MKLSLYSNNTNKHESSPVKKGGDFFCYYNKFIFPNPLKMIYLQKFSFFNNNYIAIYKLKEKSINRKTIEKPYIMNVKNTIHKGLSMVQIQSTTTNEECWNHIIQIRIERRCQRELKKTNSQKKR